MVIREVGLRDGLQSIAAILPTEHKLEWIRQAHELGMREIEVGSFVPPRLLPQMADTAEVLAYAKSLPGLFASVLVPNLKGAERAIEGCADLLLVPLSASHAHSLANLRKTPDEAVAEVARIRAIRDASGSKTLIEAGVGTAVRSNSATPMLSSIWRTAILTAGCVMPRLYSVRSIPRARR